MQLKNHSRGILLVIILLSGVLLSGCTTKQESNNNTRDETVTNDGSTQKPTGDLRVIGEIPEEIVNNIKDAFSSTYLDVIATRVGSALPGHYLVSTELEGYEKVKTTTEHLEETYDMLDKNQMKYESVNVLVEFTHESAEPNWEKAYQLQVWLKYENFDEYVLSSGVLVAPEDHPLMLD